MKKRTVLGKKSGRILNSIMNAIVPPGGAYEEGAVDYDLLPIAETYIESFNPLMRMGIPILLRYIEYRSLLNNRKLFTRLATESAVRYLSEMEESRVFHQRFIILALKMIALLSFYHIDSNAERIGYSHLAHVKTRKKSAVGKGSRAAKAGAGDTKGKKVRGRPAPGMKKGPSTGKSKK